MEATSQLNIAIGDIHVGPDGTVTIEQKVGLSKADFEEVLRGRERDLVRVLAERERLTAEERAQLESALKQTKAVLADSNAAFAEQEQNLQQTLKDLGAVKSSFGADKIEASEKALSSNDTALAELYLKQALEQLAQTHAWHASQAARIASQRHDHETGLRYIRLSSYLQPDDTTFHEERGFLAMRAGLLDEAEASFTAAASKHPTCSDALEFGIITMFEDDKLNLAEFLITWRKDAARAAEILQPYVPFVKKLQGRPLFASRFRRLCSQVGIILSEGDLGNSPSPQRSSEAEEEAFQWLAQRGNELQGEGKLEEARLIFERALAKVQREATPDPVNLGISQINLGSVLAETGRYDEAERCWHEARAALGENHEFVRASIFNFAKSAHSSGDLKRAQRWYERALELTILYTSEYSNFAVNIRQKLAEVAFKQTDYATALAYMREILAAGEARKIERWTPSDYDELRQEIRSLEELSGIVPASAIGGSLETANRGVFTRVLDWLRS